MKKIFAVLCLMLSVVTLNAQDVVKFKNAGYEALKAKKYSVALENFEKAFVADAERMGKENNTIYNMGTCAYKIKDYDKAIKYFTTCFEKGFKGEKAIRYIAYSNKKQKNAEGYVASLQKGLEKYPNSISLKKSLAKHYLLDANKTYSKGIKVLTEANQKVAAKAFDTNAPQYKAAQAKAVASFKEALPACEKSLEINPDNAQAKQMKANIEKSIAQNSPKK